MAKRVNKNKLRKYLGTKKPSKSRTRAIEFLDDMDDDVFDVGLILLLEILAGDLDLSDTYTWVETGAEPQFDDDFEFDDDVALSDAEATEALHDAVFEDASEPEAVEAAPAPEPVSSPDPAPSYESSSDYGGGGGGYDGGGDSGGGDSGGGE